MTQSISLKNILLATLATFTLVFAFALVAPEPASAQITVPPAPGGSSTNLEETITDVINILLYIVGFVAVIMLVVGGIRYVASAGDQNAVQGAKNTILYAIVGIVIAFMAWAVVNFVITRLTA